MKPRFTILLSLVSVSLLLPASATAPCSDYYVKNCACPEGCDQTLCQKLCNLADDDDAGHCTYECGTDCSCGGYGKRHSFLPDWDFTRFHPGFLASVCAAEEGKPIYSRTKIAPGVEEIQTPYGEYIVTTSRKQAQGDNAGIGLRLTKNENDLTVAEVLPGSPAEKSGLQKSDVIKAISLGSGAMGATDHMSLEDVTKSLRGKAGTAVALRVFRPATKKLFKVSAMRSSSAFHSLKSERRSTVREVSLSKLGEKSCPERWQSCFLLTHNETACQYSCPRQSAP